MIKAGQRAVGAVCMCTATHLAARGGVGGQGVVYHPACCALEPAHFPQQFGGLTHRTDKGHIVHAEHPRV